MIYLSSIKNSTTTCAFQVDIEVLSVETHLQEMVYEGSRDTILSYLKEKVSKSSVQYVLA